MLFSTTKLELTFDAGAFSAGRFFPCQLAIGNLSRPSNVKKMVARRSGRETMEKRFLQAVLITPAFFAGVLPSWAEFRLEKDLKLEPGGRFVLEADAGSVTVTGSKESGAHVVVTSDRDDLASLFDFAFQEGSATARVTARNKHLTGWPKDLSPHYEIRVPTETRLQMKTVGGGIKAYGLKGNSELETSGGSVEVSGLAGRLDRHTSGGRISFREAGGNARLETSGGGVDRTAVD